MTKQEHEELARAWAAVGRMWPGGYLDGDSEGGPTEWVEDGSLTVHPEDWEFACEPETLFEGGSSDAAAEIAKAVSLIWNKVPEMLALLQEHAVDENDGGEE